MKVESVRPTNRLMVAGMLALAMMLLLSAPLTYAARSICRTDPIVVLSNGHVVTLYADVEADLADIGAVEYTLHAPEGVSVVDVIHPDAATADLESFYFYNDSDHETEYVATTKVTLKDKAHKKVKVTAYMDLQTPGAEKLKSDKKDGDNSKNLETKVKPKN